jgi:hypothetical protein
MQWLVAGHGGLSRLQLPCPLRVCPSVSPDLVFLTSMFPRLDKLADMLGDGGSPTDWVKKKKKSLSSTPTKDASGPVCRRPPRHRNICMRKMAVLQEPAAID